MTAAPSTKETVMLSDEGIASETDDDLDDDPDIGMRISIIIIIV